MSIEWHQWIGVEVERRAWLDLDLLRQRRERFGLERPKVIPVRELLLRGGTIGAVAPFCLLLVVLFFVVRIISWSSGETVGANCGGARSRGPGLD